LGHDVDELHYPMDHELDKVIAWIDDRDAEAEHWLNEQAAERFNLRAESEMSDYIQTILSSDLLPD
jgi:hypothetical protein